MGLLADLVSVVEDSELSEEQEALLDAAVIGALSDDGYISEEEGSAIISALGQILGLDSVQGWEDHAAFLSEAFAEAVERVTLELNEGGYEGAMETVAERLSDELDREDALYLAAFVAYTHQDDDVPMLEVFAEVLDLSDEAFAATAERASEDAIDFAEQ